LPKDSDEKEIWKNAISEGFNQGVEQANQEFSVRLSALNNAYQGMALYTFLAMRGQVEPPKVVILNQAVENQGDGQKMAVGIQKQVITQNSYFVAEPNHWKPIHYPFKFQTRGAEL
jgi:defect-in-organelle-trafficking protein DotC